MPCLLLTQGTACQSWVYLASMSPPDIPGSSTLPPTSSPVSLQVVTAAHLVRRGPGAEDTSGGMEVQEGLAKLAVFQVCNGGVAAFFIQYPAVRNRRKQPQFIFQVQLVLDTLKNHVKVWGFANLRKTPAVSVSAYASMKIKERQQKRNREMKEESNINNKGLKGKDQFKRWNKNKQNKQISSNIEQESQVWSIGRRRSWQQKVEFL